MTKLLDKITAFYLTSRDFNGAPVVDLIDGNENQDAVIAELEKLVLGGLVSLVFGDRHPNSHIRALPDHHTPEKQVELLKNADWIHTCVYPLRKHLETVIKEADYAGKPYTLALALGEPQLVHHAFDLAVLEPYRNDPRYSYTTDDIYGQISVHDEYYDNGQLQKHDTVFMQSFGYAYDEEFNKYVAAFTWDLFKLTPEHQQMWKNKETSRETKLHPDYYLSQVLGQWPERISIYEAFVQELQVINQMAKAMGRPPLFREDFSAASRPAEFSSLLRPTAKEYNGFVHLLDKMLSDNINKRFFQGEVPSEDEVVRKDGKIQVQQRGTLSMLQQWIRERFKPRGDTTPMDQMFKTLRDVRELRQNPAHAIDENRFDQQYIRKQRELMIESYSALRRIRLIFANHPHARSVEVPEDLFEGKIWSR